MRGSRTGGWGAEGPSQNIRQEGPLRPQASCFLALQADDHLLSAGLAVGFAQNFYL